MRILMVNASFHIKRDVIGEQAMIQPMGVAYLSSYLRSKGQDVFIYEPSVYGGTLEEHYMRICSYDCDVIGFSQCSDEYKNETFYVIRKLRESGYKGFIVVGGHSPSLNYDKYLRECQGINCICIGEGEITLNELFNCLEKEGDWHHIHGIAFMELDSSKVVRTNPRELIQDIDTIPFPARDILESRKDFVGDKAVAYLLTSRGCYQNCSFCSVATYYNLQCGNRFRYRSVTNIVDEIRNIYQNFNITKFSFIDDNFILPGKDGVDRCREFNELMKECTFKITFEINTRVDTVNKKAIEFLKEVGLRNICIGIESFLASDLEIYNKKITRQEIETALSILSSVGYSTKVGSIYRVRTYMIVFNPYTSVEGLLYHIVYLRKYHISPKKMITKLTVYDHTDIKKRLLEDKLLLENNEWKFKDVKVAFIYEVFLKYVKQGMKGRERIRTIQKYALKYHFEINNVVLDEVREYIDKSCYDFLENLLHIAQSNSPKWKMRMNNEYFKVSSQINRYISKAIDKKKMKELEEKWHVNLEDLYIYDDL